MEGGRAALCDLHTDLWENEVLPSLDIASLISLSFANKHFLLFVLSQRKRFRFQSIGNGAEISHKAILTCIERRYDGLFDELLLLFRSSLRTLEDGLFLDLLCASLRTNQFDKMEHIKEALDLKFPNPFPLLKAAAESGRVALVERLLLDNFLTLSGHALKMVIDGGSRSLSEEIFQFVKLKCEKVEGKCPLQLIVSYVKSTAEQGSVERFRKYSEELSIYPSEKNILMAQVQRLCLSSPNAIEILDLTFTEIGRCCHHLIDSIVKTNRIDIFQWAVAHGCAFSHSSLVLSCFRLKRVDLLSSILQEFPNPKSFRKEELVSFGSAALMSKNRNVVDFALKQFGVNLATSEALPEVLHSLTAEPDDISFLHWLLDKKLVDFNEAGKLLKISKCSDDAKSEKECLRRILKTDPNQLTADQIGKIARFGEWKEVELLFNKVPQAQETIASLLPFYLTRNRVSILDGLAHICPSNFDFDVFFRALDFSTFDWMASSLNGMQWLLDHGLPLSTSLFHYGLDRSWGLPYFIMLIKYGCPMEETFLVEVKKRHSWSGELAPLLSLIDVAS